MHVIIYICPNLFLIKVHFFKGMLKKEMLSYSLLWNIQVDNMLYSPIIVKLDYDPELMEAVVTHEPQYRTKQELMDCPNIILGILVNVYTL